MKNVWLFSGWIRIFLGVRLKNVGVGRIRICFFLDGHPIRTQIVKAWFRIFLRVGWNLLRFPICAVDVSRPRMVFGSTSSQALIGTSTSRHLRSLKFTKSRLYGLVGYGTCQDINCTVTADSGKSHGYICRYVSILYLSVPDINPVAEKFVPQQLHVLRLPEHRHTLILSSKLCHWANNPSFTSHDFIRLSSTNESIRDTALA